jgi:hypothetical protein
VTNALMVELVKSILQNEIADRLLREHAPDPTGHCRCCRSRGCTLFAAARLAKRTRPVS